MAATRIPMRKLREVLRLRLDAGLSTRAIARSCRLSVSTVSGYLGRIAVAKLAWPLPPELDDDGALTRLLFPSEGQPVARAARAGLGGGPPRAAAPARDASCSSGRSTESASPTAISTANSATATRRGRGRYR